MTSFMTALNIAYSADDRRTFVKSWLAALRSGRLHRRRVRPDRRLPDRWASDREKADFRRRRLTKPGAASSASSGGRREWPIPIGGLFAAFRDRSSGSSLTMIARRAARFVTPGTVIAVAWLLARRLRALTSSELLASPVQYERHVGSAR